MKLCRLIVLAAPLMLGACGEYELVRTDAFPYGNKRTAGTGVAYVLAKMAPAKQEVKVTPVLVKTQHVIDQVEEKTFTKEQMK